MNARVKFSGGKKFTMKVRGHEIVADLPESKGGEDSAPTPPELFMASLGTCMGVYAAGYLRTAEFDPEGLEISLDWEFNPEGNRIGKINVSLVTPNAVLGPRKRALMAAVSKCVIHNTLHQPPEINMEIKGE